MQPSKAKALERSCESVTTSENVPPTQASLLVAYAVFEQSFKIEDTTYTIHTSDKEGAKLTKMFQMPRSFMNDINLFTTYLTEAFDAGQLHICKNDLSYTVRDNHGNNATFTVIGSSQATAQPCKSSGMININLAADLIVQAVFQKELNPDNQSYTIDIKSQEEVRLKTMFRMLKAFAKNIDEFRNDLKESFEEGYLFICKDGDRYTISDDQGQSATFTATQKEGSGAVSEKKQNLKRSRSQIFTEGLEANAPLAKRPKH